MQSTAYPVPNSDTDVLARLKKQRQQNLRGKGLREKVEGLRMNDREVDHAIKVTEEKLSVLKRAVEESKGLEKLPDTPAVDDRETLVGEAE